MRIGIFTDLHANLPALKKALSRFAELGCDKIIHVGDLIGIGPYPRECMELALTQDNMSFIMGNHDYWYAFDLPSPIPPWMSDEEVAHQQWTHQQIGTTFKQTVQGWPFSIELPFPKQTIAFTHYGINQETNWFKSIVKSPTANDLDELFADTSAPLIFYGHHHRASDISGKSRYINLGSAGCFDKPLVRLAWLEAQEGRIKIVKEALDYEDGDMMAQFEKRQVPARDFIKKVFIKRN